ncbi:MAG TPA: carboxylesterase family protein [Acidimicrobiales bacterium]
MFNGVVATDSGRVRGVESEGCWSFLGIRYAAPVSGMARFAAPRPVQPWKGIFSADVVSPVAPQPRTGIGSYLPGDPMEQGEDCLSLNVWTAGCDAERRPVIVFLHGGAFLSGTGAGVLYRGDGFARRGVVLVTLNYRLGFLGFLAHPALESAGAHLANRGLLDQLSALAWVEKNIAEFGGDPANVTLVGESAGAMSIADLVSSGELSGRVRRVVLESGATSIASRADAFEMAERFVSLLGDRYVRVESLASAPMAELIAAQDSVIAEFGGAAGMPFRPIVDGELLRVHPDAAIAAGASAGLEVLAGTNRDEFRLFTFAQPEIPTLDDDGLGRLLDGYLEEAGMSVTARAVIDCFRQARGRQRLDIRPRDLFEAIGTDLVFRIPTLRLLAAHERFGGRAFCYRFDQESPFAQGALGACHALELPFVFGTLNNPIVAFFSGTGEAATAISEEMQGAWSDFARTGRPARSYDEWPEYEPSQRMTRIFGGSPGVVSGPGEAERAFLDQHLPAYGGGLPT